MTDYRLYGSVRESFEFDWIIFENETIFRVLVKEIVKVQQEEYYVASVECKVIFSILFDLAASTAGFLMISVPSISKMSRTPAVSKIHFAVQLLEKKLSAQSLAGLKMWNTMKLWEYW
jgi:hypothetical protein